MAYLNDYIVVGHLVLDKVVIGGREHRSLGGVATYGAIAVATYGRRALIVSKVGEDFPEDYILLLSRYGVDTRYIKRVKGRTTCYRLVYGDEGERKLYLEAVTEKILPSDLPQFRFRVAHIGPVYREVPFETINTIRQMCELLALDSQGFVRRVDENGRVYLASWNYAGDVLPMVDFLHTDVNEAKILTGIEEPKRAAEVLYDMGADVVAITMGAEGSIVAYEGEVMYVPAAKEERLVDTTGAGDVYTAIFAIALSEGFEVRRAAAMASSASSYLVEDYGPKGLVHRERILMRAFEVEKRIKRIA
ncbi:MAG: hypothetical protein DRN53_03545 [Thermoprotei archaeon]|nr:MAG: hypothetical protein DRN53_03545 [Thermoprotei archaeon]